MKYILPIFISLFVLSACAKKKAQKQAEKDHEIILQYIEENNLTATSTESGLYIVIDNIGTGVDCNSASTVTVAYTGYFTNGIIFDQSSAAGVTFSLDGVIPGWKEGIPYFNEGGSGKLLIPSALAYGPDGNGSIPPNSVLIFDVELLDVQ